MDNVPQVAFSVQTVSAALQIQTDKRPMILWSNFDTASRELWINVK